MPKKKKRSRKPPIAPLPEIPPFTPFTTSGRNRFAARFADDPSSPPDRSPHSPIHQGLLEVVGGELYDRVQLADPPISINDSGENATAVIAPPPRVHLFSYPIGQQGKSLVHTNSVHAGALPHPQKFVIRKMHLDILENGLPVDEKSRFWWTSCVELVVVSKSYLTIPAHALIPGPYEFESPIVIEGGMYFAVVFETIHTFDPRRKIEVAVRLSGTLSRAVQ